MQCVNVLGLVGEVFTLVWLAYTDADTVKISAQSPYFSKAHCCMEEVCWPVYVGRFPVTHLSNFLLTSSALVIWLRCQCFF